MPVCLVNFAHLDPRNNGGVSRLAREVALELLNHEPSLFRVVFVVRLRFLREFRQWLGIKRNLFIIPYTHHIPPGFIVKVVRPDVVVSPLFGTEPFTHTGSIPHVVSMPDTLVFDHPELFTEAEQERRRHVYEQTRSARTVITLSEYARRQLIQHLPELEQKIRIIELGSDSLPPPENVSLVAAPYVFYPANSWTHKRHELLLEIMSHIWKSRPELKLVLTGGRTSEVELASLITQYAPPDAVVDRGFVSEAQLATLYRDAEALLFTSQYEGFGMPILEAMHSGCPVICAPLTSIPEVAGDAALYVDSDSPEDWANAFLNQLPVQRDELIERGYRQAAQFTWKKTRLQWMQAISDAASALSADD